MSQITTHHKTCFCGHDRDTHYRDHKGEGDCLGRGCDCAGFIDRNTPGTTTYVKKVEKPKPSGWGSFLSVGGGGAGGWWTFVPPKP